jgi:hypothetical protein
VCDVVLPVLLHAASSGPNCPRYVLHLEGYIAHAASRCIKWAMLPPIRVASRGPYCPCCFTLHPVGHIAPVPCCIYRAIFARLASRRPQQAILPPFRVASRGPYCPCCFTLRPVSHIAPVPCCILRAILPVLLHAVVQTKTIVRA